MTTMERYLNDLIGRCFVNGLIEDFQLLINIILQYPDKCMKWLVHSNRIVFFFKGNYQHPLTLVTPLMCVSMWSIKSFLERLLLIFQPMISQGNMQLMK